MKQLDSKGSNLQKFEPSDYLDTAEACAAYLQEFISDEDDKDLLLSAIGDVLKARRKMSHASKELGVSREGLYKSLGANGNPSFYTIINLLKVLGLGITVRPLVPEFENSLI